MHSLPEQLHFENVPPPVACVKNSEQINFEKHGLSKPICSQTDDKPRFAWFAPLFGGKAAGRKGTKISRLTALQNRAPLLIFGRVDFVNALTPHDSAARRQRAWRP